MYVKVRMYVAKYVCMYLTPSYYICTLETQNRTWEKLGGIKYWGTPYGRKLWQQENLAKENLANFVHSQTKNYEKYVIRHNSSVNVQNEQLQTHRDPSIMLVISPIFLLNYA